MKRYLFLLVFFSAMALGVGAQNVSVNANNLPAAKVFR